MLFGQPSATLATFALTTSARTVTTSPASLAAATLTATLSTAALGRPPPLHLQRPLRGAPQCRGAISGLFQTRKPKDRHLGT